MIQTGKISSCEDVMIEQGKGVDDIDGGCESEELWTGVRL